ncbi:glutamine-hydrolyzing carbamoyl-phosphate synthase small subunit [Helicobacter sp. MIT 14-3879]|uniref:glutamine-hydrolyzing carbamoyl-phosphate synthase small subunit n=1 Tax=Helicobacter sp. MIT 14-3879 TaxID=2040649 RepID=UPI000E1F2AF3|nr:glutamine-hydrolyzing carbamoyl-phosphate synthase small subunit [Helicobacter sp. MIT 14-3879]RDU65576.1 carbamoyl phosphate synthase small subunit [Helicobacter sp. MIT 14-3879]
MDNIFKKAYIYLDGYDNLLEALSFGTDGTKVGEMIFNTSLSGYQEILSDPSYAGQFVLFTMPEIGIVGVNDKDIESYSNKLYVSGIIVRNYNAFYSNFRAMQSLHSYLKENNTLGICNIDTRFLTKLIRNNGAMNIVVSTKISSLKKLKETLVSSPKIGEINYIKDISTKKKKIYNKSTFSFETLDYKKPQSNKKRIIVIDFGIKQNILNELSEVGLECEIIGFDFSADDIIKDFNNKKIGGVFLSNGPGDPSILTNQIKEIKKLVQAKIPMFGICLGHQLLSIANGYKTYKLAFGHHGANHPVKNLITNEVEITSQNHIYSVSESISKIATITHKNLFDGTIEGLRYNDFPIISIQHHPEASPGPKEASKIFKEFALMVKEF